MYRITNLSDKEIYISSNATLQPHQHVNISLTIDDRLLQLSNMGIIKIEKQDNVSNVINSTKKLSKGEMRHKRIKEAIKRGDTSKSISLNLQPIPVVIANQTSAINKTNNKKGKRK